MTNAELLAKIKAEIERRIRSIENCPFIEAELGASEKRDGKLIAYKDLLSFISTLESEKPVPNDLAEATSKCKGCNNVKGCVTCVNGDQWAHYEESEKPIEGLEQETQVKRKKLMEVFGPMNGEQVLALKDFARHFAQWGAEHLKEIEL